MQKRYVKCVKIENIKNKILLCNISIFVFFCLFLADVYYSLHILIKILNSANKNNFCVDNSFLFLFYNLISQSNCLSIENMFNISVFVFLFAGFMFGNSYYNQKLHLFKNSNIS